MRNLTAYLSLGLALWVGLAPAARADRDRDRDRGASSAPPATAFSHGGDVQPGNCSLGRAERDLDVNNVSARVFNNGSLFFGNGSEAAYLVPQQSNRSPIYATGIWVGGFVGDELRVAGATYADFEFWPGPLEFADGALPNPADCSAYDRIFKVGRQDIANYEATGSPSADLAAWPVELGAPVLAALGNGIDDDADGLVDEGSDGLDNDGDGFADERDEQERVTPEGRLGLAPGSYTLATLASRRGELYDLAAGDRPEVIGDQAVWWVMNDVGNLHANSLTPNIGIEVQVLAWSFSRADALNDITFYRYRVIKRSPGNLEETYLAIFSDPDLGDAGDDYVGVDTTLSLGYVYNADNADGNGTPPTYGANPPAAGYDFFQGPIVDLDGDGIRDDTLGATSFMYFVNGASAPRLDPNNGQEIYNVMQGEWTNGEPLQVGGNGYQQGTAPVTTFAFAGNPVTGQFWSEVCPTSPTSCGSPTQPGDRRLVLGTGPFTLEQNAPADIVFGLVFAQGSSNLASIDALRVADRLAQTAFDIDFELAAAPQPPPLCDADSPNPQLLPGSGSCLEAVELDGAVTLRWGYPTNDPNYLGQYEVVDRLLSGTGAPDSTYNFEGFNIYQYPTSDFDDSQRQLIATFDVINDITTVIDYRFDPATAQSVPFVALQAENTGIRYSLELTGLTNYTDYYFGITAFAANPDPTPNDRTDFNGSIPAVIESAPRKITVRPSRVTAAGGGSRTQAEQGDVITPTRVAGAGAADVAVRVVDPTRVVNAAYRIELVDFTPEGTTTSLRTYRIYRDGQLIVDGVALFNETGRLFGIDEDVFVVDGLQFFSSDLSRLPTQDRNGVIDLSGNGLGILEVAYPGQDPCTSTSTDAGCTTYAGEGNAVFRNNNVSGDYYVSSTTGTPYGILNATVPETEDSPAGGFAPTASPFDYEIRFTEAGGYALYNAFLGANLPRQIVRVPFEVWNVMTTPDDPSDDVRMIPVLRQNSTALPLLTDWTNTFPTTEQRIISGDTLQVPVTEQLAAFFPDRPDGYALFEADAVNLFGGAGGTWDPAADGDTQVDLNPTTGQACSRQDYYIAFCARNDQTNGGNSALSAAFVQLLFADIAMDGTTPPAGTVVRIKMVRPLFVACDLSDDPSCVGGDVFEFSTAGLEFIANDAAALARALDFIGAVPNPYLGSSAYETGNLDRVIRFINLPEGARIRIYTISGTLIREFQPFDPRSGQRNSLDWDLQTQSNLPVASGMYLAHIEVPGVGERVLRLGVVNRLNSVNVF